MSRTSTALWTTLAAAALIAGGCSTSPTTESASPTESATPTESASPTDDASPSDDASPTDDATADSDEESSDTADPFVAPPVTGNAFPELNASRLITDVRAADHDGFSRLVLEFSDDDDSRVGYSIEYVDEAVSDGKGDAIEVDGSHTLDIHLAGLTMPEESDPQPFGTIEGTTTFKQIESLGPFEGMSQIVVGLDSEAPVRVTELQDPYRIVIDVKTT